MRFKEKFSKKALSLGMEFIFWWIFSFIKVCKKQARFEALNCIFIAVLGIACYLLYKSRVDLNTFVWIYFSMGLVLTLKNIWLDTRKREVVSC